MVQGKIYRMSGYRLWSRILIGVMVFVVIFAMAMVPALILFYFSYWGFVVFSFFAITLDFVFMYVYLRFMRYLVLEDYTLRIPDVWRRGKIQWDYTGLREVHFKIILFKHHRYLNIEVVGKDYRRRYMYLTLVNPEDVPEITEELNSKGVSADYTGL